MPDSAMSGEPGGAVVEELLADPRNECFAHAINLCEVYYDACRRSSPEIGARLISDLSDSGVRFRSDMDLLFWQPAGRLKAEIKRISLADCFGLILSAVLNAEFVTADRHEMEIFAQATGYRIRLIR
jgi:hypothetical protein